MIFFTYIMKHMNNQNLMYKTIEDQAELAVEKIVNRILASGKMSRKDHILLTSSALANGELSDESRRQINRVFDYLQTSRLKLVDW
ncbi:hypothetical protein ACF3DV_01380 [Chlorogloeopsis fritschii PCC 9212]|uniref:Uncharacterized protein n=1 Tax=Chlorogloeopsis fritschii PCC 6912 TaxID=211165 RepID=A0A433NDM1_CHLFR|nr:hypothetical protein [Chlorogloeopsis fritschii]MBF2007010.1 hypothetical protein [Chlorogloeopsis fritschii C42_A2020_084]RUR80145.1 hypothetical protein PCC6912_30050 [Chlorogloeopsis fritschii PCC 6912]